MTRVLVRPLSGRPCLSYMTMPITADRRYVPPVKKAHATKPVARSGKAEPWAYGPFRVVAARRVSEEEQLSVECYAPTIVEARSALRDFLADFRAHMVEYNEKVVLVQQEHLGKIEAMIEERGAEARRIEAEIEGLIARKQSITHPDAEDTSDADASP